MNLDNAVKAHSDWKVKFRAAISGKTKVDAPTIGKDNCCELGQWLHGEGKGKFGTLASYAECVARHAEFHREAAKVAGEINAGRFAQAEALMASSSSYAMASTKVGIAVAHLRKECKL